MEQLERFPPKKGEDTSPCGSASEDEETIRGARRRILALQKALKHDGAKIRLDLIPADPIFEVGKVLTHGAKKYGERNWETGIAWSRLYGAALRHILAFWTKEDIDPESTLPHLAHAVCCLLFLLQYSKTRKDFDDRCVHDQKV